MANVRGLLVLSLVCLLVFQMMSPSEAAPPPRHMCTKSPKKCGIFSCPKGRICIYDGCVCWYIMMSYDK
ncbi:hypothetical protein LSAT2_027431 [Lamellibrachia satsuma]|nr:hypothetical protein LSAT2_027431 [Lamellibrachia satsuma]